MTNHNLVQWFKQQSLPPVAAEGAPQTCNATGSTSPTEEGYWAAITSPSLFVTRFLHPHVERAVADGHASFLWALCSFTFMWQFDDERTAILLNLNEDMHDKTHDSLPFGAVLLSEPTQIEASRKAVDFRFNFKNFASFISSAQEGHVCEHQHCSDTERFGVPLEKTYQGVACTIAAYQGGDKTKIKNLLRRLLVHPFASSRQCTGRLG
jgi:hypothetical protein